MNFNFLLLYLSEYSAQISLVFIKLTSLQICKFLPNRHKTRKKLSHLVDGSSLFITSFSFAFFLFWVKRFFYLLYWVIILKDFYPKQILVLINRIDLNYVIWPIVQRLFKKKPDC